MSAGTFRHLLQLLSPVSADDGEGGQAVSWDEGPTFFGDVQAVSAQEQAIAGAIQTIGTHRVRMYFDARVTGQKRFARVNPTGTDLQILGIRDLDGRQRWIDVDCSEVVE